MMDFYCNKCNTKINEDPIEEFDSSQIKMKSEAQLLPVGKFVYAHDVQINFGVEIKYLVHQHSVRFRYHEDSSRHHGCCGPSNFEQLTLICPNCKNEIGLISGDCLFPHFVGISPKGISLKPLW
ncbi:MAG: hypothetical protein MI810_16710 [Flavobacteriales bacterium]|nr:hypothetical protein [Flavobacteriales bacterium]